MLSIDEMEKDSGSLRQWHTHTYTHAADEVNQCGGGVLLSAAVRSDRERPNEQSALMVSTVEKGRQSEGCHENQY